MQQLQEEAEELSRQIKRSEAKTKEETRCRNAIGADIKAVKFELTEYDDCLAEAKTMGRESALMRQQQAEWERSQFRMLRLTDDLQRQRVRGAQSQALVATRIGELQRDLPLQQLRAIHGAAEAIGGPPSALMVANQAENADLRQQISMLENERQDLLHKRTNLASYLRSNGASGIDPQPPLSGYSELRPASAYPSSPYPLSPTDPAGFGYPSSP